MNKYTLCRRYLVIYAAISFQINQSFSVNIIYKPAYLIGMRFNHYFKMMHRDL